MRVGPLDPRQLQEMASLIPQPDVRERYMRHFMAAPDGADFDMVLISRRYEAMMLDYIKALHEHRRTIVMDMDDDPWSVDEGNPAYSAWGRKGNVVLKYYRRAGVTPTFRPLTPAAAAGFTKKNRDGFASILRAVDAVTVTTPALAEKMRAHNPNVYVLPNQMNLEDWLVEPHPPEPGKVLFGWAGSASHKEDLLPMRPVFAEVLRRVPEAHLVIIGFPEIAPRMHLPTDRVHYIPWGNLASYKSWLASLDVILAPSKDTPFNRCKSDIRVMEAWLCGRPVVASEATYGDTVRAAGGGFVARNTKDWIDLTAQLLRNELLRRQFGEAGMKYVIEQRTYRKNADKWEAVYQEVAERRAHGVHSSR